MGVNKYKRIHMKRSKKARLIDEKYVAPIPANPETWIKYPDKYDLPGVDLGKNRYRPRQKKKKKR